MKLYQKRGDIRPSNRIIITKNGMQTINPTEEMLLADGWVEYVAPAPTFEELKRNKLTEIEHYDASRSVNEFFMNGVSMWLDKATRAGLMLRFQAEQAAGNENTTLWYEGQSFQLPLVSAVQMLYALEVYASQCYDNTQYHMSVVNDLTTAEELEAYDYRTLYPEKLSF